MHPSAEFGEMHELLRVEARHLFDSKENVAPDAPDELTSGTVHQGMH